MSSDPRPETVGVIDVGSNSIKLLLAARGDGEPVKAIRYLVEETRIGEGLTGEPPTIPDDAIERGAAAIARLVEAADGAEAIRIVATSAARDAANRAAFADAVKRASGLDLRVLTGDEEATFIARGALCDPALAGISAFSLLDLGGGSLECIQFSDQRVLREQSLRLGSVRLAGMLVSDRRAPLTRAEQARIRAHVEAAWRSSIFESGSSPSGAAILAGGSASLLAAMLGADARRDGIALSELAAARETICDSTFEERIERHGIPASRADIFPTALVTLEASLRHLGCQRIRFTHYNLRYGIADALLDGVAL